MQKTFPDNRTRDVPQASHHPIFLNYLMEEGYLTSDQASQRTRRQPSNETWIGRMMISHGLITVEQVNEILIRQDLYGGFFGENAVALGLINHDQLETLLESQELRRNVELIEELALAGILDFNDGLTALSRFYSQRAARGTATVAT